MGSTPEAILLLLLSCLFPAAAETQLTAATGAGLLELRAAVALSPTNEAAHIALVRALVQRDWRSEVPNQPVAPAAV